MPPGEFEGIPVAPSGDSFRANPLEFLYRVCQPLGSLVLLSDSGPQFARSQGCRASLAVFGGAKLRTVLTRPDVFSMPTSIAEHRRLPPVLSRLNHSLFSMYGEEHRRHQHILHSVLSSVPNSHVRLATRCCASVLLADWLPQREIRLLQEMRKLAASVARVLCFGDSPDGGPLASLIHTYFYKRRAFAAGPQIGSDSALEELLHLGEQIDSRFRHLIAHYRRARSSIPCYFSELTHSDEKLDDDQLVSHGNILFMSTNEPIAAALTWTVLLLSQHDAQRGALCEVCRACSSSAGADWEDAAASAAENVVRECLRLLPPNAIMSRITAVPTDLLGSALPAGCEIVFAPYVNHRDPNVFSNPLQFHPDRWLDLRPGPYSYLPFGAGVRHCLGRHAAMLILPESLRSIYAQFDPILSFDQPINWSMNVTLSPSSDPAMLPSTTKSTHQPRTSASPLLELMDLPSAFSRPPASVTAAGV